MLKDIFTAVTTIILGLVETVFIFAIKFYFEENFPEFRLLGGIVLIVIAVVIARIQLRGFLNGNGFIGRALTFFWVLSGIFGLTEFVIILEEYFPNLDAIAAMIALCVSIACGVVFYSALVSEMKNVEHATQAKNYLKKNSLKITKRTDKFVLYEHYYMGKLTKTSTDPEDA